MTARPLRALLPLALLAGAGHAFGADWSMDMVLNAYRGATVFIEAEHQGRITPLGSGIVVSREGHVLTAKHIFDCQDCGEAQFYGRLGRRFQGDRLPLARGSSAGGDIDAALMKLETRIDKLKLPPVAAPKVGAGDPLFVLGYPQAEDLLPNRGEWLGPTVEGARWRTSIPLVPGYSGGPVFDRNGALVGIAVGGLERLENLKTVMPLAAMAALLKEANISLAGAEQRISIYIDERIQGDGDGVKELRTHLLLLVDRLQHVQVTRSRQDAHFVLTRLALQPYPDEGLEVRGALVRPDGQEVEESGTCVACAGAPGGAVRALTEFLDRTLLHPKHGPYRQLNIESCNLEGDLTALQLTWAKGPALERHLVYEVGDWRPDKPPGTTGLFFRWYDMRNSAADSAEVVFRQVYPAAYRPKACSGDKGRDVLMARAAARRPVESLRHAASEFRTLSSGR